MGLTIEEACAASRMGTACGYTADGRLVFDAKGPSLDSARPRWAKRVSVWPHYFHDSPKVDILFSNWGQGVARRLHRLKPEVRAVLDGLDWRPNAPLGVVDLLAEMARRR